MRDPLVEVQDPLVEVWDHIVDVGPFSRVLAALNHAHDVLVDALSRSEQLD